MRESWINKWNIVLLHGTYTAHIQGWYVNAIKFTKIKYYRVGQVRAAWTGWVSSWASSSWAVSSALRSHRSLWIWPCHPAARCPSQLICLRINTILWWMKGYLYPPRQRIRPTDYGTGILYVLSHDGRSLRTVHANLITWIRSIIEEYFKRSITMHITTCMQTSLIWMENNNQPTQPITWTLI